MSRSVALDASGNVFISGYTYGVEGSDGIGGSNAGSADAFLSKFDSDGNNVWTTQIGTSGGDKSQSVAVDTSGNVYISGDTLGDLAGSNVGERDAFLVKYETPEPATLTLVTLGGLMLVRRRKRRELK